MAPLYAHNPTPAYKVTKAALNMLTVQYALDLQKEGFSVVAVSPGVCLFLFLFPYPPILSIRCLIPHLPPLFVLLENRKG